MNSLQEIKEKVAKENKFSTWEEYNIIFMQESYEKLARECYRQGGKDKTSSFFKEMSELLEQMSNNIEIIE